jgi:hypothetical protein
MSAKVIDSTTFPVPVDVVSELPEFEIKPTSDAFVDYNMHISASPASFDNELSDISYYKRAGSILRQQSIHLDKKEVEYNARHVDLAKLGTTVQEYIEELVVQALMDFMNPTHIVELSDDNGYKKFAVLDSSWIKRVVNDKEKTETLIFYRQPIVGTIFTGASLEKAQELMAQVAKGEQNV